MHTPKTGVLDAGLRPRPFPDEAASLLPGLLAATRTGLTPASDDELTTALSTTHMINHLSTGRTVVPPMSGDPAPQWPEPTEHVDWMVLQLVRGGVAKYRGAYLVRLR